MNLGCLVDVSGRLEEPVFAELIQAAYRASKCYPVILLVRPSLRERVDRVLDKVVEDVGTGFSGVLFKDPESDMDRILSAAQLVSLVVASDECFRALLARRRIPYHSPETGIDILNGVERKQLRTA